jgi:hypothetical protein
MKNMLYYATIVLVLSLLTGCPTVTNTSSSSDKDITAFAFVSPELTGAISESVNKIYVRTPNNVDTTSLVASFITTGSKVTVGSVSQISGSTENDFTNPVTYTVTAKDRSTRSYDVELLITPAITSFTIVDQISSTINGYNITVVMPAMTNLQFLVPVINNTPGNLIPASGVTQDFRHPVFYTIDNGGVFGLYKVTVEN